MWKGVDAGAGQPLLTLPSSPEQQSPLSAPHLVFALLGHVCVVNVLLQAPAGECKAIEACGQFGAARQMLQKRGGGRCYYPCAAQRLKAAEYLWTGADSGTQESFGGTYDT